MDDWLTFPVVLSGQCSRCRVRHADHDDEEMDHEWRFGWPRSMSERESNILMMMHTKVRRGDYDAPLPLPAERRRIRERAKWTQQQFADELHVARHAISTWETKAGWSRGVRLRGREPVGDIRSKYSELLKELLSQSA